MGETLVIQLNTHQSRGWGLESFLRNSESRETGSRNDYLGRFSRNDSKPFTDATIAEPKCDTIFAFQYKIWAENMQFVP